VKTLIKQIKFLLYFSGIVGSFFVHAVDAPVQDEDCSQEILLSYFPAIFVKETMNRFNVPKEKWDAINRDLAVRDKEIIKIVESKASKMNPNPLKDPQQRQTAVKLFRETLVENFSAVMKENGISDDKQIQSMLEDIQQQKAKRFALCMQKHQGKTAPDSKSKSEEDEDEDEDDGS